MAGREIYEERLMAFEDGIKYINYINMLRSYNDAMMHMPPASAFSTQFGSEETMRSVDSISSRAENIYNIAKDIEMKYDTIPRADLIKESFDLTRKIVLENLK